MQDFIAYFRVSTKRQGASGLGLEAQQKAVQEYVNGKGRVVASFVEVESGRRKTRPELQEALRACKRAKATLVVAKLDRLSRSVSLTAQIMDSGVEFVACDNPHANKFTIHILAAVAEFEADMISKRIKDALSAAKDRGVLLGTTGAARATENRTDAEAFASRMAPVLAWLNRRGLDTLMEAAEELNRLRFPTASGRGRWHIASIHRLRSRICPDHLCQLEALTVADLALMMEAARAEQQAIHEAARAEAVKIRTLLRESLALAA